MPSELKQYIGHSQVCISHKDNFLSHYVQTMDNTEFPKVELVMCGLFSVASWSSKGKLSLLIGHLF